MLVGEAAVRVRQALRGGEPLPARQRLGALVLLGVGSNFPDFDLFYTTFSGGELDYALHHRGHTHTLVGAMLGGAFLALCWYAFARVFASRQAASPAAAPPLDAPFVALLCLLGPLLHLAMDGTNSYGIHPFWPLDNRWMYGDAMFIIEPTLWVIAAVPLAFACVSPAARGVAGLIAAGAVGVAAASRLVPGVLVVALTLLALALAAAGLLLRRRKRTGGVVGIGIAGWLFYTAAGFAASHLAAARMDAVLALQYPGMRTLDTVLSPMPVNPFCFDVIAVQVDADTYAVRKATLTLAPDWLPATRCPIRGLDGESTAPLMPAGTTQVAWRGEQTLPLGLIPALAARSCRAEALMRFVRAPFFRDDAAHPVLGDARYDQNQGLSFAEIELAPPGGAPETCPQRVPPWTPPRQDLLDLAVRPSALPSS